MTARLNVRDAGFEAAFAALLSAKRETEADVGETVRDIIADVRARGDDALLALTRKFDRFDVAADAMRFSIREIDEATGQCDRALLDDLELAATRIRDFHARQLPADLDYTDDAGIRLGLKWTAVSAAGLYVPGGTASYPSSVLMNALPARVAGVERLVMVVPTPDGEINPLVLAAAKIAGIDEIYRIGGAQAIAALAFGTATIKPVDKIVGPGNAYVAEAKRQVFGTVGIDMIAGPSEILVVADKNNDPAWIATDLLSQAEHDTAAQSILITDDGDFADAVVGALEAALKTLPRADIAAASWRDFGAVIVVNAIAGAIPLIDRIAPEHLELALENADEMAARVRNAGAIFLGRYAPEALGDYLAGPNHVLPTNRSARFSSGLGVLDFMKRSSLIGATAESLAVLGPATANLARAEGLDAHARSITIRLNRQS
ncbi:MAG: histidinol dehydrogenase [Rhodospirillaceae bacterium]|nr:histidinol dehydrogenase [Rhodospirillaceae bacterium]